MEIEVITENIYGFEIGKQVYRVNENCTCDIMTITDMTKNLVELTDGSIYTVSTGIIFHNPDGSNLQSFIRPVPIHDPKKAEETRQDILKTKKQLGYELSAYQS